MKLALISLDGNGVYNLKHMPFLSELAEEGSMFIVDSIFPTLTDLVHTSVMTGVEPRIHWVVENGYYDRLSGVRVKFYEYDVAFNPHKVIKAPLVQDLLRQRGIRVASVSGYTMPPFSNTDVRIFPPFFSSDELYRTHGRDWKKDVWVLNSALYLYEECKPDLLLVHFASIDGMQHDHGPESSEALKAVETVDSAVRTLWERLKNEYAFIIFADHGQESVHTWVNLREYLERNGIEVLRISSGGGVHVYLKNPGEKEEAYEILRRAPGVKSVFFREDLPYLDAPVSGDLIVSAKEGYWFCHHRMCRGIKGRSYWVKGMHGSMNERVMKVPLIIWGLNVRREGASLYDIAPTILKFFGLEKRGDMKGEPLI
ncbi:alkaline phosphatase family protein [Pyrococcus abyssi]|uniref:Phosphodiesterase (Nucleotide pyrophosphorylase) n=1 Tax=Pyrococcus abyssi (strain GE5 / Orsay) TaxID=272844 RepID=Q9UZM7_PYRAB|nr:alkaline phosphatase family protein [Pyrococcus abyssi]CAB50030.1 Phosphodiesterase (nucleotide pyrophosphorylase) [Pyrococcus abyssi GE5]CCE70532.1 TPA: phosphonoacetate hydrolase related [Pyrococcus abyssi GE5]